MRSLCSPLEGEPKSLISMGGREATNIMLFSIIQMMFTNQQNAIMPVLSYKKGWFI